MAWHIGIDEAGYGPNLGPLVMSAVACRVPPAPQKPNLWKLLRSVVRRQADEDDGRLFVDDSKLVYSTARGLGDLETAVLALLDPARGAFLEEVLARLCCEGLDEIRQEFWYTGRTALPIEADAGQLLASAQRFADACRDREIDWPAIHTVVVCPARFNALVDRWESKGAVLALAMAQLVRTCCAAAEPGEPLAFVIDKHGGRNHYSAVLQHAFDDGVVLAREEGALRSVYQVIGVERSITFTFEPRADSSHFCVALASMLSKYLREGLMLEFNGFWRRHLPDLKPTAGYPGDSTRFLEEIRPTLAKLQVAHQALWRER